MGKFSDFLAPLNATKEKEVIVSDRFVRRDENGEPLFDENGKMILRPFKIRALTQEENANLVKAATTVYRDRAGGKASDFDKLKYSRSLIVAATVDPDFSSKEMCDGCGVVSPLLVPEKILFAGEYQKLADAIAEISGIGVDLEEEAAKN
nr:MAG TPA: tail assembly chaperone protein [Caudoviricetes sp.]